MRFRQLSGSIQLKIKMLRGVPTISYPNILSHSQKGNRGFQEIRFHNILFGIKAKK